VAIVITNAERAKDGPHRMVGIEGAAWGGGVSLYTRGPDLSESPAKPIADRLYAAPRSRGTG
jgi:hypothetical protein